MTFGECASFAYATFGEYARFDSAVFKSVNFVGKPDRFVFVSFARARFDGEADFSGRTFERADFTNARFYSPPDFDAAASAARIDFSGVHIGFVPPGRLLHWTSESKVPVRLRRLRKIAEDTKNHDLERDLYIEERKAERGVYLRQRWEELKKAPWIERPLIAWRLIAHLFWILVMLFYWALANYGRSFLLPAAWLGLSVPFFHWRYAAILEPLMPQAGTLDAAKFARAAWMVALGNAVPFVGPLTIDADIKKFLFCPRFGPCLPIPPKVFRRASNRPKRPFDHPRVFHRPCAAELFQDQVMSRRPPHPRLA